MTQISEQELLKLATISSIEFLPQDIAALQLQVEAVLSYAARVQEVAADAPDRAIKLVNVVRADAIVRCNSAEILACSPDQLENYFVVPKIIETH